MSFAEQYTIWNDRILCGGNGGNVGGNIDWCAIKSIIIFNM